MEVYGVIAEMPDQGGRDERDWQDGHLSALRRRKTYVTKKRGASAGKMSGAFLTGKTWSLPSDADLPTRGDDKKKHSPLLKRLREEKEGIISGGIYHRTQIDFTYNSNHI